MQWSKIFPCYPFQLRRRRGGKVRIGSRKIYVDLPCIFPLFLNEVAYRYGERGITEEEFEREWEEWLQQYKSLAYFNGKPIATVYLAPTSFYREPMLCCRVDWEIFFDYLDYVARYVVEQIKEDGKKGLAALYNFIYDNYHALFFYKEPPEPAESSRELENFKRVVRRTGEKNRIENLLNQMEAIAENLEHWYKKNLKNQYKEDYSSIELYTLHFKSDIRGALKSLENMNIIAIYFYLRNILELFIKLLAYMKVAEEFGKEKLNMVLRILYLYDKKIPELEEKLKTLIKERTGKEVKETIKLRKNSILQFENTFRKKMSKILSQITEKTTYEELFDIMVSKGVCVLGISRGVIEDFCKRNGIDTSLVEYWRACSYAIHQQTPLPFYSLLEVKGLRAFLEVLLNDMMNAMVKISGISKEKLTKHKSVKESILTNVSIPKQQFLDEIEKEINRNKETIKRRLKEIVENPQLNKNVWFKPRTLSSLFELMGAGSTEVKKGVFQPDDINELASSIQATGFKVDIYEEIKHTFEAFHLSLQPLLEKIMPQFRSLPENEKRGITFYLLLLYLPKVQR